MKSSILLLVAVLGSSLAAQPNPPNPETAPLPPIPSVPPAPLSAPAARSPGKAGRVNVLVAPGETGSREVQFITAAATPADNAVRESNVDRNIVTVKSGVVARSIRGGRTLVIQSGGMDPTAQSDAEEDLSVMALVLKKAAGASGTEERRIAMGIELDDNILGFAGGAGARNFYLEGYGALFLLNVRFPLIAPTTPEETPEPKESKNDDWADAREEYLSGGNPARFHLNIEQELRPGPRFAPEEYDGSKVEDLKTDLLQALKNASHLRGLKSGEFVTVVVQGTESGRADRNRSKKGPRGRVDGRSAETVMTIRVKKEDILAFAKGSLDLDGFRKKAAIQTYLRRGELAVSGAAFGPFGGAFGGAVGNRSSDSGGKFGPE